ncbi:MAG: aspartyl protease family protein [Parvularcula sp.]
MTVASIRRGRLAVTSFLVFLFGCAAAPPTATVAIPNAQVPYSKSDYGVLTIPVQVNGSEPMPFVLDTAATISVIDKTVANGLGLYPSTDEKIIVRGLVESAPRPMTDPVSLTLANAAPLSLQLAILDTPLADGAAGVIGLDILGDAAISVDPESPTLKIYWNGSFDSRPFFDWDVIRLKEDPKSSTKFGLHFAETHFGNKRILTLLDTGADFSAMNWAAGVKIKELRTHRETLRNNWIVNGAIGEFKPKATVRVGLFSMGEHIWEGPLFFVFDFEALDVIGAGEDALIVAGAPLLKDRRYIVDLGHDRLYIDPSTGPDIDRGPAVRIIPSNEGGRIQQPD